MTEILGFKFLPELYYSTDHLWVKSEADGTVRIGFDDIIAKAAHEVFYIKLSYKGTKVSKKQKMGLLESRKYTGPIPAPISGEILEVNEMVVKFGAHGYTEDPYDKGWLFTMKPSNLETELKTLMHGEDATVWFKEAAEPAADELGVFKERQKGKSED
jgi:glycine cleavage system H protein